MARLGSTVAQSYDFLSGLGQGGVDYELSVADGARSLALGLLSAL